MVNLRELAESDLATTLEGEFALPVELVDPEGIEYQVTGQVLYETVKLDPETAEEMVINTPVVTLRRSTLARVPVDGETWTVRIPITPSTTAALEDFIISGTKAMETGGSIGFIRLYLQRIEQTP